MLTRTLASAAVLTSLTAPPAAAQGLADLEAPPPPVELQFVPARFSYDGGLRISYGTLPQFGNVAWVGLGGQFAWGRNWTDHRLGVGVSISFEGPVGVEWATHFDPGIQWDWAAPSGLYLGATVGPGIALNAAIRQESGYDVTVDFAPFLAARIGWSQRFSLIARRFHLAIEPKVRLIQGQPGFAASLIFGAGRGY